MENQITIIYTAGVRKIKLLIFNLLTSESIVAPETGAYCNEGTSRKIFVLAATVSHTICMRDIIMQTF